MVRLRGGVSSVADVYEEADVASLASEAAFSSPSEEVSAASGTARKSCSAAATRALYSGFLCTPLIAS